MKLEQIEAARGEIEGFVTRTPTLRLSILDERTGGAVALKAENLQRTGSFKIRGVSAKLSALGDEANGGVVTGSAGNHGHALAYGARARGIQCQLFVPTDAPVSKVEAARRLGAVIHTCEGTVDECVEAARERAAVENLVFVHPFDDEDVIAGQGSIGLELLEDIDDVAAVLVPLGGGGLASGIAVAIKSQRPDVEVIGVQASACAPYPPSLEKGEPVRIEHAKTIADGIAVKRPGEITLPLVKEWLDDVLVVSDDEVADAMAVLLSEAKLVVEGAGAVGLAALLAGHRHPVDRGITVAVLSGGNADPNLLAAVARRSEEQSGRSVVLSTLISDRPGSLASLLAEVAELEASVVEVRHVREGADLHIAETGVELILETRGPEHTEEIVRSLTESGYDVSLPWGHQEPSPAS